MWHISKKEAAGVGRCKQNARDGEEVEKTLQKYLRGLHNETMHCMVILN